MKKNFLFLASPNIGIFESWGPIIKYKLNDRNIYTIIPKFDIIFRQANRNLASLNILSNQLKIIIFKTPSDNWYLTNNIFTFERSMFKKIPDFIFNKFYKKLKFIPYFKKFEILLFKIVYNIEHINDIDKYISSKNFDFLAYDVLEENKKIHNDWLRKIKFKKITFETGINFHIYNEDLIKKNYSNKYNLNYMSNSFGLSSNTIPNIKNLKALVVSNHNINYYKKIYDLKDKEIIPIGVPRNNSIWMSSILSNTKEFNNKILGDFVFLISRPAQEYFIPLIRKKEYIKDINKICKKYNLNLVIKLHPKESTYHGKRIYYDILGKKNLNKNWFFSEENIYQIALKSKICITFFTSVCIDFIKLNIPVIEIMNLRGIPEEDNDFSLRDKKNSPITQYRNLGFVLGADNYDDLSKHVHQIIYNKEKCMALLKKNYDEYLSNPDNFVKLIPNNYF